MQVTVRIASRHDASWRGYSPKSTGTAKFSSRDYLGIVRQIPRLAVWFKDCGFDSRPRVERLSLSDCGAKALPARGACFGYSTMARASHSTEPSIPGLATSLTVTCSGADQRDYSCNRTPRA
jgi:hypothetical protein